MACRERYGLTFGQGSLLARRLVEAACDWSRSMGRATITRAWSTIGIRTRRISASTRTGCRRHSTWLIRALLEDLDGKRAARRNADRRHGRVRTDSQDQLKDAGRDHWPGCSINAGQGWNPRRTGPRASDRIAAFPRSLVTPEDVAATIYYALGIPARSSSISRAAPAPSDRKTAAGALRLRSCLTRASRGIRIM